MSYRPFQIRPAFRRVMRGADGFTLIELMIVVGIIGILVSIAGPRFERYMAKARQSEAKLAAASMYSLEKSFYAEYSAYIADFDAIGFQPEGSKRFYSYGWNGTSPAGSVTGYAASAGTSFYARVNFPASWTTCAPDTSASVAGATPLTTDVNSQIFLIKIGGQITKNATACDWWTVDHNKLIVNSTIGY